MRVAVCADVKEPTVAVNVALVALAGTLTDAGTVTTPSLLERLTLNPPLGAAAVKVTVQGSVPGPVMVVLEQETALRAAGALPAARRRPPCLRHLP